MTTLSPYDVSMARLRLYGRIGGQRPISYVVEIESFAFEVKSSDFTVDWSDAHRPG